jgi:hypothetical protein
MHDITVIARRVSADAIQSSPRLSFRDGLKDRTRNLEIAGSRYRAPRNDVGWIRFTRNDDCSGLVPWH